MTGSNAIDDTADDHERFEAELLAQDRNADHVSTADINETTAKRLVGSLVETGVVTPVPDQRILVHDPSGEAFESITQLAIFHEGWTAGLDRRETN